jgi:hypothetical protein
MDSDKISLYREQAYRRTFRVSDASGYVDLTGKTVIFRLWQDLADAAPLLTFTNGGAEVVYANQTTNKGEFDLVLTEVHTDRAPGLYMYSIWDETNDSPIVPPTVFQIKPGGR